MLILDALEICAMIYWTFALLRGLSLITYAPRETGGGGGVKPPIHFYCVLHAKTGGGARGPENM